MVKQSAYPSAVLNRREFLWYSFGAVLLLSSGVLVVVLFGFLTPTSSEISIGSVTKFPASLSPYPVVIDEISLYLVNTGATLIAFDRHTPHHKTRCLFTWVAQNNRFEDPCTGSRFALDGSYLLGPALQDLNRYPVSQKNGRVWIDPTRLIAGSLQPTFTTCITNLDQGELCWNKDN